mgnify:CR=1 FL=1
MSVLNLIKTHTAQASESLTDKAAQVEQQAGEKLGLIEPAANNMPLINGAYFVAAILFIFSLVGLSKQESAEHGVWYGIIGMVIALVATIANPTVTNVQTIMIAMVVGGLIGTWFALRVEMTQMPELVAMLHSFVGLAAVAVGFNSFLEHEPMQGIMLNIHLVEVFLGVFIGAEEHNFSVVESLLLFFCTCSWCTLTLFNCITLFCCRQYYTYNFLDIGN